MECDDLKNQLCHFSETAPGFGSSEVHIVMWSRMSGNKNSVRQPLYMTSSKRKADTAVESVLVDEVNGKRIGVPAKKAKLSSAVTHKSNNCKPLQQPLRSVLKSPVKKQQLVHNPNNRGLGNVGSKASRANRSLPLKNEHSPIDTTMLNLSHKMTVKKVSTGQSAHNLAGLQPQDLAKHIVTKGFLSGSLVSSDKLPEHSGHRRKRAVFSGYVPKNVKQIAMDSGVQEQNESGSRSSEKMVHRPKYVIFDEPAKPQQIAVKSKWSSSVNTTTELLNAAGTKSNDSNQQYANDEFKMKEGAVKHSSINDVFDELCGKLDIVPENHVENNISEEFSFDDMFNFDVKQVDVLDVPLNTDEVPDIDLDLFI